MESTTLSSYTLCESLCPMPATVKFNGDVWL